MASLRRQPLHAIAVAIALLQGAVMYLVGIRGEFYVDDFLNYGLARQNPLSRHYLEITNFGHFDPGFRAAFWLFQHLLPFDYHLVRLVLVCLDVLAVLAFWRLLTLVIGARPLSLALLGCFAFSFSVLTCTLWVTNSINTLPTLLLLILSVDAHVRWMVRRRVVDLVVAPIGLAAALLFWEKPLLFGIYLPLLLVLLFAPRLRPAEIMGTLWRAWPLWILDIVALLPYLYFVARHPYTAAPVTNRPGLYVEGTARGWFFGVVPSGLGAPWNWHDIPGLMSYPPTLLTAVVDQVVVAAVLAVTLLLRRQALRWWLFIAVVSVSTSILVVHFRVALFGIDTAQDTRYFPDTAMLAYLALGLAMVGPRIGAHAAANGWRDSAAAMRLRRFATPVLQRALAGAALALVATAFSVLAAPAAGRWHELTPVDYMSTLRANLAALPAHSTVWEGEVPPSVVPVAFIPYDSVSNVVSLVGAHVPIDRWGATGYVVDGSGHAVPAPMVFDASGSPPDGLGCADRWHSVRVSLDHPLPAGTHFLVLHFDAHGATSIAVGAGQAGRGAIDVLGTMVALDRGNGVVVLRTTPVPMAWVSIEVASSQPFCVQRLQVGHPRPEG